MSAPWWRGKRMENWKDELQALVVQGLDLGARVDDGVILDRIDQVLTSQKRRYFLPLSLRFRYRQELFDSLRRLDVLSEVADDPEVTEIMVNGPEHIFVERDGKLEEFQRSFSSGKKLEDVAQQIAAQANRRVNAANPIVDARLEDGSRVNIVLPPVALDGPVITIRRFGAEPISMEQLIRWGSITQEAAQFMKMLVICGYNIFISGGTGSGKTTFLGALAEYIPSQERVITIEDAAELRLVGVKNLVRLETRMANPEGDYAVTIRDLIRNALRQRPDRIIVGEIRSEEAFDMLNALNTGHDGSLSTGHGNSPRDMLSRIEMMVLMGMDLPLSAVRRQIASGLDILVHLGRLRDKSRRVLNIEEIVGVENERIVLNPIYRFQEEGEDHGKIKGKLTRCSKGLIHREKLLAAGYEEEDAFHD